jgi:hypothetical protein
VALGLWCGLGHNGRNYLWHAVFLQAQKVVLALKGVFQGAVFGPKLSLADAPAAVGMFALALFSPIRPEKARSNNNILNFHIYKIITGA